MQFWAWEYFYWSIRVTCWTALGINIDPDSKLSLLCKACKKGKASHNWFLKETDEQGHKPGDLTYSDLWGPAWTPSLGQSKYYIQFTDDATHRCTVRFMKEKSEAFKRIKDYECKVNAYIRSFVYVCFLYLVFTWVKIYTTTA